jgi:hypothetical protein
MIDRMYDRLLVQPQYLETVCHECHDKRTAFRKQIGT